MRNFKIKRLGKRDVRDAQKLILLFQEAFEIEYSAPPEESYLTELLGNSNFIAYAAIAENKMAGGLTAHELPMLDSRHSEIFIYDIAVKTEFQRRGLGKKLLSTLKEYAVQNGISEIFVDANEEDKHALDFYHSTGGKAEKVVQFSYSVND